MSFDRDKPAGNTKIKLSDEEIRANNYGLQDAISRDHKFPTGYGVDAGEHTRILFNAVLGADVDPGTGKFAIYPKDNAGGDPDLFCQDENNTVLKLFYGEVGTVMIFGQNSAPTGWTRKANWQDNAMLCYAASGSIGSGGSVNPQSTHTHTGPSHTHTTPSHTLTTDEIPVHHHTKAIQTDASGSSVSTSVWGGYAGYPISNVLSTGDAGGGQAHEHGATGAAGTGATSANSGPYYQEVIAATRD